MFSEVYCQVEEDDLLSKFGDLFIRIKGEMVVEYVIKGVRRIYRVGQYQYCFRSGLEQFRRLRKKKLFWRLGEKKCVKVGKDYQVFVILKVEFEV